MRCLVAVSSWFVQRASLTVNIDLSDVTNKYTYYSVLYRTVGYMRKRIDHWCSVVPEKSQPSGPPFSGKLGKPRFPLERWALGLGFFCPHWTPMMDSIYLTYLYQPVRKIKRNSCTWATHRSVTSLNCKMMSPCCISEYSGFSGSLLHVFPI